MIQLQERFDIAIVGSGAAGLSAAVNATIRNKKIIVFGNDNLSSKLEKAPKILNYLGMSTITGKELMQKFREHIQSLNINIAKEKITTVFAMGDYFTIMAGEKMYEAKSVILALGTNFEKPIEGEESYIGKGVSYCATCDAPLYKGRTVAVIGYNKEAEKEANYLSEVAKETYYVPSYNAEHELNKKIKLIQDKPVKIFGDELVRGIKLENNEIAADGIFILKDSMPPSQLVPGLEIQDGHIKVDRNMRTNIEGCFAAGDCTGKPYQYMKAAGEGQVAALSAVNYLYGK